MDTELIKDWMVEFAKELTQVMHNSDLKNIEKNETLASIQRILPKLIEEIHDFEFEGAPDLLRFIASHLIYDDYEIEYIAWILIELSHAVQTDSNTVNAPGIIKIRLKCDETHPFRAYQIFSKKIMKCIQQNGTSVEGFNAITDQCSSIYTPCTEILTVFFYTGYMVGALTLVHQDLT